MMGFFVELILISILIILIISIIISLSIIIKNKLKRKQIKNSLILLILSIFISAADTLFLCSHSTYYKYNDWIILNSNINMVRKKYGEFDYGHIEKNKSGTVGYYIYTDNSPIMPDHLKHYYYMEYDSWGMIYRVYESCEVGG